MENSVSVAIPVYNGSDYILKVLESVKAQTIKPYEIVVVDDGSTDDTREIVSAVPEVRLIPKVHSGLPDTRNLAIKESRGDLICVLDSDMVLEPDWLEEILKNTDFKAFAAATGYVDTFNKDKSIYCLTDEVMLRRAFAKEPMTLSRENNRVNYFNYVFRKEVFTEVGLFDATFKTNGEDIDFFWRFFDKGYKAKYVPSAVCHHIYLVKTLGRWMRKRGNYSMSALMDLRYHVGLKRKLWHYGRVLGFFTIMLLLLAAPIAGLVAIMASILFLLLRGLLISGNPRISAIYALTVCWEQFGRVRETVKWHLGRYRGAK